MKKLLVFAGLCTLLCTSVTTPSFANQQTKLSISGEPEPHPQTIYVKTRLNGTVVNLPVLVFFTDTVGDVKSEVAYMLDIPADSFELTFQGQVLDENLTLNAYGITTGSILGLRSL
jgi:hypothetical protein